MSNRLYAAEKRAHADLVREICGNPFRPVAIAAEWLQRQDRLVPRLAERIDQTGQFEDLPILADALVEVECPLPALIAHCRLASGHVRGCWAIDRLLGRV